ncbi:MAG TPA: hypothetical protein VIM14_03545, partial [Polyangia bacterium]
MKTFHVSTECRGQLRQKSGDGLALASSTTDDRYNIRAGAAAGTTPPGIACRRATTVVASRRCAGRTQTGRTGAAEQRQDRG